MTTLTLRKVGGSTMLALSPALLQILGRRAGDLLKEQEKIQAELDKDRDWVTKKRPVGEEIL